MPSADTTRGPASASRSAAKTGEAEVVVNGENRRVPAGLTVAKLLQELDLEADRVAVERNRSIVRRPAWASTPVESGDRFEIVQFVGGG